MNILQLTFLLWWAYIVVVVYWLSRTQFRNLLNPFGTNPYFNRRYWPKRSGLKYETNISSFELIPDVFWMHDLKTKLICWRWKSLTLLINIFVYLFIVFLLFKCQSEHIGQCDTPHHLSDVRRGAPSCIWDYFSHSDVTICVLNAI